MKAHGKILVDFANADSTDAACLTYFENIQSHRSLKPDFAKQIRKTFPFLRSFLEPLNATEKALIELIPKQSEIIDYLNRQFSTLDYELVGFDFHNRTLSLISLKWERSVPEIETAETISQIDENGTSGFLNALKMLGISAVDGPIAIKIDALADEIKDHMGMETIDRIQCLMKTGSAIDRLTSGFSEKRLKNLQRLTRRIRVINEFHHQIKRIQMDIREVFEMLVRGKSLRDIPPFLEFLKIYNSIPDTEIVVDDDDALVSVMPINGQNYYLISEVQEWHDVLLKEVAFWMVEFFRYDKSKRSIRKCPQCATYFMPNRPGNQKFCRKRCRLIQQKRRLVSSKNPGLSGNDPKI